MAIVTVNDVSRSHPTDRKKTVAALRSRTAQLLSWDKSRVTGQQTYYIYYVKIYTCTSTEKKGCI